MSIRILCLSGVVAALAATSALPADYGDHRPVGAAAERLQPRRHADRLPYQLKVMWRREEHGRLHGLPREQRHGWLRAEWSHMSEAQKQAKIADLQAKWDALPANVRETLLQKKRQRREARRMNAGSGRGPRGHMEQPVGPTPQ
ncbi:MAG TPA: hypothetical protein VGG69_06515 [Rhizomicrobium sp.]